MSHKNVSLDPYYIRVIRATFHGPESLLYYYMFADQSDFLTTGHAMKEITIRLQHGSEKIQDWTEKWRSLSTLPSPTSTVTNVLALRASCQLSISWWFTTRYRSGLMTSSSGDVQAMQRQEYSQTCQNKVLGSIGDGAWYVRNAACHRDLRVLQRKRKVSTFCPKNAKIGINTFSGQR